MGDDVLADHGRGQDVAKDENRQEIEKERDRGKHHSLMPKVFCCHNSVGTRI